MIVVIATMRARQGQEDRLRDVLTAIVVESRQEEGCIQFDLLVSDDDPHDVALYEEWESHAALNAHLRSRHVDVAYSLRDELTEALPRVISYRVVNPARRAHSGPTSRLDRSEG
jgi:quinol monooxygenase YgiN